MSQRQHSNGSQIAKGLPGQFIERRHAARFDFQLPAIVRWQDGPNFREVRTRCNNLSAKGINFVMEKDITLRTTVEIEVTLPHQITLAGEMRVCCLGHVQRVDSQSAEAGVTVVVEMYRLLSDALSTTAAS